MVTSLTTGAFALPSSPVDRAKLFADCAGRYAALSMHESLFDGAASEAADLRYDLFIDLLDAVRDDAVNQGVPPRQMLYWRVEAKVAHASLLQRASFHPKPHIALTSHEAALSVIQQCERLLFGS